MANTNFSLLTNEQKTFWSMDFWKMARNNSFIMQFAGTGANSMIQQITELTASEKGTRAVLTLIADLESDGVMGDSTLEGNEEAIRAFDTVITIDQMRQANRLAGRMADQASIVNFRETSRDVLAYWFADRIDQLAFLTLSGVTYNYRTNGALRTALGNGMNFSDLDFASAVTAPSTNRHYRAEVDASGNKTIVPITTGSGIADLVAADQIGYRTIVELKAAAKDHYIRGVRQGGNEEIFHMFVTPHIMAQLKLDADFISNVRSAGVRGDGNQLFQGSESVMVDGVMVHEFRHVYHNDKAATQWGASSNIPGTRVLFCGAQALGMADLGEADYVEETFDYGNQYAISVSKILGFLKPKFVPVQQTTSTPDTPEDFGVIVLDVAN